MIEEKKSEGQDNEVILSPGQLGQILANHLNGCLKNVSQKWRCEVMPNGYVKFTSPVKNEN